MKPGSPPSEDSAGRKPSFDRDFLDAIKRGHLTQRQAIERGDRKAYAIGIANKYQMPLSIALMVTDNRITLAEGIRRRDAVNAGLPIPEKRRPFEIRLTRNVLIAAGAVAGIVLVVALILLISG